MLKFFDQKIRRAFSDAAAQYDALTSLHREIGRELIRKIETRNPAPAILDVGMGTGWFTSKLVHSFPGAQVAGVDSAGGMVDAARRREEPLTIVQADARALPFRPDSFDVVTSNLAYQWVEELPPALGDLLRVLRAGGHLCLTMFGYHTLAELFESLEASVNAAGKEKNILGRRLADAEAVEAALQRAGFAEISVVAERITVHFPDLLGLVKWTRDIGANHLAGDLFVGKELLSRAGEYYDRRYRDGFGIRATFEVFWVSARKPRMERP